MTSSGIASVFDYGEEVGNDGTQRAYIVMELVNGESLEERLRRENRLGVSATLDIIAQAAAALQDAHDCDLIHRDIKPANLLLRSDGVVKLTDFGIVRVLDSTSLTETGLMVGTIRYMSPEQLSGRTATPASDIYALGIVAYFCVAGHPPFDFDESMAVALAHVSDPLPPMPPDVPQQVAELFSQMLAKDPDQRPSTAAEVARRAAVLQDSVPVPTLRTQPKTPTPVPARVGGSSGPVVNAPSTPAATSAPTLSDRQPTTVMTASAGLDDPRERQRRRGHWMLIPIVVITVAAATAAVLWLTAGMTRRDGATPYRHDGERGKDTPGTARTSGRPASRRCGPKGRSSGIAGAQTGDVGFQRLAGTHQRCFGLCHRGCCSPARAASCQGGGGTLVAGSKACSNDHSFDPLPRHGGFDLSVRSGQIGYSRCHDGGRRSSAPDDFDDHRDPR